MSHAPKEQISKIRLRFKLESEEKPSVIISKINNALKTGKAPCTGRINHHFITLHIPESQQHYWSPQLTLTFEEQDEVTTVRGLYAPRPTVWTMFVFFYSIIGMAILVLGTLGLSYSMLDKPSGILWWVPALVLVFLSIYLVAFFGQKVGHKQIDTLHDFFEEATGLTVID
ncbi:MAG: hypothetical protein OEX22_06585 [Cyclobacteriaceae bacterium]|nr:hypothetical protein [Cyclobacteriaceae bacterium]